MIYRRRKSLSQILVCTPVVEEPRLVWLIWDPLFILHFIFSKYTEQKTKFSRRWAQTLKKTCSTHTDNEALRSSYPRLWSFIPPHRCGISKSWLDSLNITQVCLYHSMMPQLPDAIDGNNHQSNCPRISTLIFVI